MHGSNGDHTIFVRRLMPSLLCAITALITFGGCKTTQVSSETETSAAVQVQADSTLHEDAGKLPDETETPSFSEEERDATVPVVDNETTQVSSETETSSDAQVQADSMMDEEDSADTMPSRISSNRGF